LQPLGGKFCQNRKMSLNQKGRFMEYAKEVEADETGKKFDKAMKKIVPRNAKERVE
jgi:hypothetical protein